MRGGERRGGDATLATLQTSAIEEKTPCENETAIAAHISTCDAGYFVRQRDTKIKKSVGGAADKNKKQLLI